MRGNSFGKLFSITSFGESHGRAMGVVIDGMPPGIEINEAELQAWLDRRAPGRSATATNRKEPDQAIILSGVFEGKTLGTPISVMVENQNQKSSDYEKIKNNPRPGHADQTTLYKFGVKDHRGGGRASGRETISRVIGGYFASLILPQVEFDTTITQIGKDHYEGLTVPLEDQTVIDKLLKAKEDGESFGGKVQVIVKNMPKGLGEPPFEKLKSEFASALLSIGSCIGITIADNEQISEMPGSELSQNSKNFAGIEGGISNGDDLKIFLSFKAPSTVGQNAKEGRHDPCILPRVIPVIDSMVYLVIADHFLRQCAYSRKLPYYSE